MPKVTVHHNVVKYLKRLPKETKDRIKEILKQLEINPLNYPDIKQMYGEWAGYYRSSYPLKYQRRVEFNSIIIQDIYGLNTLEVSLGGSIVLLQIPFTNTGIESRTIMEFYVLSQGNGDGFRYRIGFVASSQFRLQFLVLIPVKKGLQSSGGLHSIE